MKAPTPTTDAADDGRASLSARDRAYRRVRIWGLSISALLHLGALVVYPRLFGGLPATVVQSSSSETQVPTGIEIINLVEVASPLELPEDPEEEPERVPIPVPPSRPTAADPDEALPGPDPTVSPIGGLSAAERLQPRTNDGRLWARLPAEITELSPEQRIENLLYARLETMNDSAAAAAERARRATDWTFTDGAGDKWGVSPGKLHLGPVTLPLPFVFGLPAGASDDLRRAQEQDAEIRRAAGQAVIDETNEERAKAIRERKDAERKRTKPDTTRVGR